MVNYDPIPEKLMDKIRVLSDCADVREIPNFPGYAIAVNGQVWSVCPRATSKKLTDPPRLLKSKLWKGSMQVNLYRDNQCYTFSIARLLLTAFVSPPFEGAHASFKDGNPLNIELSNLLWSDISDTHIRGIARNGGAFVYGTALNHSKLTPETVRAIRAEREAGASVKALVAKYGATRRTIERTLRGEFWKQVSATETKE